MDQIGLILLQINRYEGCQYTQYTMSFGTRGLSIMKISAERYHHKGTQYYETLRTMPLTQQYNYTQHDDTQYYEILIIMNDTSTTAQ
jgi:hypothetical protein